MIIAHKLLCFEYSNISLIFQQLLKYFHKNIKNTVIHTYLL